MKKNRIIKTSSKLLIITLLIGNPLLRDTLTVFATEKNQETEHETKEVPNISEPEYQNNFHETNSTSKKLKDTATS